MRVPTRSVAAGSLSVDAVTETHGVAIQARLYAEDAEQNFMPSTGVIQVFDAPGTGVRIDTGVEAGASITDFYDPMIAKVIAHGETRAAAIDSLRDALSQTTVLGITSNKDFLVDLLGDAAVRANDISTEFIDAWLAARSREAISPRSVAVLAALWLAHGRPSQSASVWQQWQGFTAWRIHRGSAPRAEPAGATWLVRSGSSQWKLGLGHAHQAGVLVYVEGMPIVGQVPQTPGQGVAVVDGVALRVDWSCTATEIDAQVLGRGLRLEIASVVDGAAGAAAASQGTVRAPMMGLVIAVHVNVGQRVQTGERLATLESMKMETPINAPVAGTVKAVGCQTQSRVERNQELFTIEAGDV